MRHKYSINPLERKSSHRKSLTRNMISSFFEHEKIKTTKAKARVIRRLSEKLITRAKQDSVHNRRLVARTIHKKAVLAKLFTDIAQRSINRQGGYVRMFKLGQRSGDAAELVLLELVDKKPE